jgi:hypothetical protein
MNSLSPDLCSSVALVSAKHAQNPLSLTEFRIKNLEKIFRASFFELSHAKCTTRSKTAKQTPQKILKDSHIQRNRFAGFFPGRSENFPIGDATVLDDFFLPN